MEVGYLDSLSPDKSDVRGFIFGEPVFAHVDEVLAVIGDEMSDAERAEHPKAVLYDLISLAPVGYLSYEPEMGEVAIRLQDFCGGWGFPYIVSSGDLHDLVIHGRGKALIREDVGC